VCASWKSSVPTVPSVTVRVNVRRCGDDAAALNHWTAPAMLVSEAPSWLPASSTD
jgi:hypothetical protein